MEERESTVIQWGGLGYQQKYLSLLKQRYITGWAAAALFFLGTVGLLSWTFFAADPQDPSFSIWMGLIWIAFIAAILLTASLLQSIDKRLRSIEVFLDFRERRGEVRHQVFCRHHLHCLAVHYFASPTKDPAREYRAP